MRIPERSARTLRSSSARTGAQRQSATRSHAGSSGLSQAGCCAEVCVAWDLSMRRPQPFLLKEQQT